MGCNSPALKLKYLLCWKTRSISYCWAAVLWHWSPWLVVSFSSPLPVMAAQNHLDWNQLFSISANLWWDSCSSDSLKTLITVFLSSVFFLFHVNSEMVSVTVTDVGPTKNTEQVPDFHDEKSKSSLVPLSLTCSQFSWCKAGDWQCCSWLSSLFSNRGVCHSWENKDFFSRETT